MFVLGMALLGQDELDIENLILSRVEKSPGIFRYMISNVILSENERAAKLDKPSFVLF